MPGCVSLFGELYFDSSLFLNVSVVVVYFRAVGHVMSSLFYPLLTFALLAIVIAYWAITAVYPFFCPDVDQIWAKHKCVTLLLFTTLFFHFAKKKKCITVKLNDHWQYINYSINPSIKHSVHYIYITSLLLNADATFPLYWLSFLLYFLFVTYFHKCTKLMQKSHDCDLFKYILPLLTQSPWLLWPVSCPHQMSRCTRCLTRLIASTHERPATPRYAFKCHCHSIWTDWR